mgnify:CR=1 FL=1
MVSQVLTLYTTPIIYLCSISYIARLETDARSGEAPPAKEAARS